MRPLAPRHVLAPLLVVWLAGCGPGGRQKPPADPCAGVLPVCTSDAQCGGGATCDGCGLCAGGAQPCADHAACAEGERCVAGRCAPGGCTAAGCDGQWCNPDTRACEPFHCRKAGCDAGLHCDPDGGACVECLGNTHCLEPARPWCDRPSGACVGCRTDRDCEGAAGGPRCRRADPACVACLDDDDCDERAPKCAITGACVACVDDRDCPGARCSDDGTCAPAPRGAAGTARVRPGAQAARTAPADEAGG